MKLKKIVVLIMAVAIVATLTSCGTPKTVDQRTSLGTIDVPGVTEVFETLFPGKYEVVAFPTGLEVIAALRSGRVAEIMVTEDLANLMKDDKSLKYERFDKIPPVSLTMLTRTEDADLTAKINNAINTLKENGKLDELYQKYVANAAKDNMPVAPDIQAQDGAETIVVGVCGDLPPHDYVTADGRPSGYNVALLSEIAKLTGMNVKFETIPFSTKFAALKSNRIDVFFLHLGLTNLDGIAQTKAYGENAYLVRMWKE